MSNIHVFDFISSINESKTLTKHISCKLNVNWMVENAIHIKSEIKINVDASVRFQKTSSV